MKIEILPSALEDLADGFAFYEDKEVGLGNCFLSSLYADIDSLGQIAGINSTQFGGYHRMLATRFPFALYYNVEENRAKLRAVLDCRRDPIWVRERLA